MFKEAVIAIKKQLSFSILPIAGSLCETETTITAREHKTGKGRRGEVRKKREKYSLSRVQVYYEYRPGSSTPGEVFSIVNANLIAPC